MAYMEVVINKEYRPIGYQMIPYLEKIGDIHLNSDTQPEYELGQKGSRGQIIIFSGIGLLILLIACFNFVNISTALSFKRAKEVSMKKIFGSDRKYIILSFVSESAIAIIGSLVLAFLLVKILTSIYFRTSRRSTIVVSNKFQGLASDFRITFHFLYSFCQFLQLLLSLFN